MNRALAAALVACLPACDHRPRFDPKEVARAELGKGLRPGFLLVASTSAMQTEGEVGSATSS